MERIARIKDALSLRLLFGLNPAFSYISQS